MRRLAGLPRVALTALLIAAMAMLLPAAIMALSGAPQAALVVFIDRPDPAGLPEGATILGWQGSIARFDGVDASAARKLYATGAILVMPVRKSGCVSLRKT